jgi:prevent-host-death family protein
MRQLTPRSHVVTMVVMKAAREMKASEFKARCLEVMDTVARTGDPVIVTKRGKPVAKLCPITEPLSPLVGCMKGRIEILGDIVSPVDVEWDAEK